MDGIFRKMQHPPRAPPPMLPGVQLVGKGQRCPLVAGSLWWEVCSWTPQGLPTLTLGVCP